MIRSTEPLEWELYRAMTVARKLEVAHGLWEMAWALKTAVIRRDHPTWSEPAIRAEVRRHFANAEP